MAARVALWWFGHEYRHRVHTTECCGTRGTRNHLCNAKSSPFFFNTANPSRFTVGNINSAPFPHRSRSRSCLDCRSRTRTVVAGDTSFPAWPASPLGTVEKITSAATPDALALPYPLFLGASYPPQPGAAVSAAAASVAVPYGRVVRVQSARQHPRRGEETQCSSILRTASSGTRSRHGTQLAMVDGRVTRSVGWLVCFSSRENHKGSKEKSVKCCSRTSQRAGSKNRRTEPRGGGVYSRYGCTRRHVRFGCRKICAASSLSGGSQGAV